MAQRLFIVLAVQFGAAAYLAVWFVGLTACGLLAAMSGLCVVAAGAIDAATDLDCGYANTPQGQEKIEDAPHFRAWERELAGTWDFRNGAPE